MASPSLTAVNDFFNFTKICFFCKKESKTFKIPLSCYSSNSSGQCVLTKEGKKKFSFKCPICGFVNQLDFTQMCNQYTAKILQNKTLLITTNILKEIEKKELIAEKKKRFERQIERVEKIEQALIKLKLQEYE